MGPGSGHVFSDILLHLNWHCKNDRPMIGAEFESQLHALIEEYCRKTKGIHYQRVGGTADHLHLVFQMEPFVVLSDFIGQVKGYSSHEANKLLGAGTLKWQRGYGVVSFSRKHLNALIRYVKKQKEHHAGGTTNDILETYGKDTEEVDN